MLYRLIQVALACFALMPVGVSRAAEITHQKLSGDIELIGIEGPIASGDLEKFRQISIRYKKALVVLSSEGGTLLPAIEIGKIIRIAGYVTVVPEDTVCASSCALIWVAGSTRWLSPKGHIGFHASYRDNKGRLEESGVANALIGNYLTLLNLPEKAIIFATRASPDKILWLTKANKTSAGIDFEDFDPDAGEAKAQTPPSQVIRPPVIALVPMASPAGNTNQEKPGNDWIEFGRDSSGGVHYYNPISLERSGAYVRVWRKVDYSRDRTVRYRLSLELASYSCSTKMSSTISYVHYDKYEKMVDSYDGTGKYEHLIPETMGMALWEKICRD